VVPNSEADKRYYREEAARYAKGCQARSGDLLPYITTANTARDLDVIRAALGEKKLNYLGISYGTYLGAVYATLFPTHVRRMVVDSVVDPSVEAVGYQGALDMGVGYQNRWQDWEQWVARHDSTYHLGNTAQKVENAWLKVLAKAHSVGVAAFLRNKAVQVVSSDSAWSTTAQGLADLSAESPPVVGASQPQSTGIPADNEMAVLTAVRCNDTHWTTDWATWDRDFTKVNEKHPFYTWVVAWAHLPCATWPVPQQTPIQVETRDGLPRVLIVEDHRDGVTPYSGALALHERLKGSVLITKIGAGSHAVAVTEDACVNHRVDAYLLEGKLPSSDWNCYGHQDPKP
jgi:pimeloyl-ACP methyl ester carboxylesterase